jgi:hypothetical protein
VRGLKDLFQPHLRGLRRDEVPPATWRLARTNVVAIWAWLALGLLLVAVKDLELLSRGWVAALAAAWLAMVMANGLLAAATQLALLRDGWGQRQRGWRARGVVGVAALLGMSIALAVYLWRFASWLWA